ncbi:MAG: rhodanese-like domain-containing protein [Eubacteriaceae bacterium]|nr:rhodanese-like domain-containing protein [Eubacteriaceae bacterium]
MLIFKSFGKKNRKEHISKVRELQCDPKNIIIDLRNISSYNAVHIPGTLNVPEDKLFEQIRSLAPDYSSPIYLFCMTGERSADACSALEAMGYWNVWDLGSISGWKYGYMTISGFQ